jgi:hypothetical protein
MYIRTAWNDFFSGVPTLIQNQDYQTRQTPSGTSVHVLNCLFRSISSSQDGGALYFSSITYLLIESSSFFSCKTSEDDGGAIFFSNGGQCVFHKVCGYDCNSHYVGSFSSRGQFSCIYANNDASSKNYVNYSSIAHCVKESSNSWCTMRHQYGKICFPSVNISMNKCYSRIIYCNPYADSNSVTFSLSFSSFTDNIALGSTCILLEAGNTNYEIKSCNILRNKVTSGSQGTIYANGNLKIEDSCVLENTATYIFYQSSSSYTITLSNCTVDKTTNNGYLTTKSTVAKSFILALNHMSTRNCHSEYDSAGTLSPIIQTPSSSKKQLHCCTCGNLFHLPQQGNFVSLTSILVFNFIHPYASGDL